MRSLPWCRPPFTFVFSVELPQIAFLTFLIFSCFHAFWIGCLQIMVNGGAQCRWKGVGHGLPHLHHGCASFLWKNMEANFRASWTLIKLFHIEFQFCIGKTITFCPITPTHSTLSFTCYTFIGMAMFVQKRRCGVTTFWVVHIWQLWDEEC